MIPRQLFNWARTNIVNMNCKFVIELEFTWKKRIWLLLSS